MSICSHCNGTGRAPSTIVLECIGCQTRVKVVYATTSELMKKADNVLCADCKSQRKTA